jgi:hypothetical protein
MGVNDCKPRKTSVHTASTWWGVRTIQNLSQKPAWGTQAQFSCDIIRFPTLRNWHGHYRIISKTGPLNLCITIALLQQRMGLTQADHRQAHFLSGHHAPWDPRTLPQTDMGGNANGSKSSALVTGALCDTTRAPKEEEF